MVREPPLPNCQTSLYSLAYDDNGSFRETCGRLAKQLPDCVRPPQNTVQILIAKCSAIVQHNYLFCFQNIKGEQM